MYEKIKIQTLLYYKKLGGNDLTEKLFIEVFILSTLLGWLVLIFMWFKCHASTIVPSTI